MHNFINEWWSVLCPTVQLEWLPGIARPYTIFWTADEWEHKERYPYHWLFVHTVYHIYLKFLPKELPEMLSLFRFPSSFLEVIVYLNRREWGREEGERGSESHRVWLHKSCITKCITYTTLSRAHTPDQQSHVKSVHCTKLGLSHHPTAHALPGRWCDSGSEPAGCVHGEVTLIELFISTNRLDSLCHAPKMHGRTCIHGKLVYCHWGQL